MPIVPPKGPQRDRVSDATLTKIERIVPRIRDDRRRRPLYFDGRFLAARDLTREQDYFLSRQADLGRAGGFGVVAGLVATEVDGRVVISPGHGVTPSGEMVVLTEPTIVDPREADVSEAVRVRLAVSRVREVPGRTRSGLFVIALRPIEYEANPIAQYPTTLDGDRGVHNGDIVEATAVTLIPYPDLGDPTELRARRSHAAKEIFVDRVTPGLVTDALPIAMIAIERGRLLWVDPHLVRREVGAEAGDILGVSGAPLALREAFLLQYDQHLRDLLPTVHGGIVATDHFLALPPAGPMPKSSIDRQLFVQRFFPAEVDVDLSVVPSDELGAVLEEARLLPPIDLTNPEELKGTSVVVLVPVDRADLDAARAPLVDKRRKLPPVAPNLLAKRRPLERLALLPLMRQPLRPAVPAASPEDKVWRDLLDLDRANDLVWYVRRRALSPKPSIVAEVDAHVPQETELPDSLRKLVESLKAYGITEQDARRIQPQFWEVAEKAVLSLHEKSKLYSAAALVELAQAPELAGRDAARAWVEYIAERLALGGTTAKLVADTFTAGRPATAVLVRAGVLHDLARLAPDSRLAREPALLDKWQKQLREVEDARLTATKTTGELRRLLFQVADLQDPPPPQQPGEPEIPEKLRKLVESLKGYGVTLQDARRIELQVWGASEDDVLKLREKSALFAAAALVELALAPSLDREQAVMWARYVIGRFKVETAGTFESLHDTFKAGRPVTLVLVRAGVLHELLVPWSKLAADEPRMKLWQAQVATAEQAAASPTTTAERLRRLLFAVLDIQEAPAEPALPESLKKLVDALDRYGILDSDARRIQSELWEAGGDNVVSLHAEAPLLGAAALVELAQAPHLRTKEEAKAWANHVVQRLSSARPERIASIEKVFAPGQAVTAVLVRGGFLPELLRAAPDSRIARDPARMKTWLQEVEAAEKLPSPTTRANRLRALLFEIADLDDARDAPGPGPGPEPGPGPGPGRVIDRYVPRELLERYRLADIQVDEAVLQRAGDWIKWLAEQEDDGLKLLAAAAVRDIKERGAVPAAEVDAAAAALKKKYYSARNVFVLDEGSGTPPAVERALADIGPLLVETGKVAALAAPFAARDPAQRAKALLEMQAAIARQPTAAAKLATISAAVDKLAGGPQ